MITDFNQLDLTQKYTYADYLTWWFDERVELIKGFILKMSPAPSDRHQSIELNIATEFNTFLKGKKCRVRIAPYDVRLKRTVDNNEVTTVVQPDISIICNLEILDQRGCNGTPDMVIEILSESNRKHDLVTKYQLYEEAGVKEYWIVYPMDEMIEVYLLVNDQYVLDKKYLEDDILNVKTLEGLTIDLKDIFN